MDLATHWREVGRVSGKKRGQIQGLASPKRQWTCCCPAGLHIPLISNPSVEPRRCQPGTRFQSCWPHVISMAPPGLLSSHGHLPLPGFSCNCQSEPKGHDPLASKHPSALCSSITPTFVILFCGSHLGFSTPAKRC